MKAIMKKITTLILLSTIVASINACGSDDSSHYKEPSTTKSSYSGYSNYSGYSGISSKSSSSSSSSSYSSFTNKYGTRTTKCVKAGCDNYIASSGDTNCCTKHSNRCGECYKYIDGDALFCMDCLTDYLT